MNHLMIYNLKFLKILLYLPMNVTLIFCIWLSGQKLVKNFLFSGEFMEAC